MHLKYDLYESKILEPQKYLTVKLSETLNTAQKGDIGGHSSYGWFEGQGGTKRFVRKKNFQI